MTPSLEETEIITSYYGGPQQVGPTIHTHKRLYIYLFLLTIFGPTIFTMVPRNNNIPSRHLTE